MYNDNIDCTVKNCKYCNNNLNKCILNCIKIGNCCKCMSYKAK